MHRPRQATVGRRGGVRNVRARCRRSRRPPGGVGGRFGLCVFALRARRTSPNVSATRSRHADDALSEGSRQRGDRRLVMNSATVISLPVVAAPALAQSYARPSGRERTQPPSGGATVLEFKRPASAPGRARRPVAIDADHALIRAIAAGSKPAMRTLFLRHHARVLRYVMRIVRDHAQAEMLSEVFLDVGRRADRFGGALVGGDLDLRHRPAQGAHRAGGEAADLQRRRSPSRARRSGPGPDGGLMPDRDAAPLHRRAVARPPRGHRSRLFPREVDQRDRRHARDRPQHREEPHVLRAQTARRAARGRRGSASILGSLIP